MATRFDFKTIIEEQNWLVLYPSAQGYQDKYLSLCQTELKKTEFPNVETEIEEFKTGGVFFNVEKTKMLSVSFSKTQFKNLGIYFRAQQFGNVMYYSLFKTVDTGFWDAVQGRGSHDKMAMILSKCKNLAQWEEIESLYGLGDLVFQSVVAQLDPAWKENRHLFESKLSKK